MNKLTLEVPCGYGSVMSIVHPCSLEDGGVEWRLRYGNPEEVRLIAASLIDSYDYLLSGHINQKEAERRLRLLRQARRAALEYADPEARDNWMTSDGDPLPEGEPIPEPVPYRKEPRMRLTDERGRSPWEGTDLEG